MITLILMRHAKSSWANLGQTDFERPLNNRGISNAEKAGKFLKASFGEVEITLCSPATRTRITLSLVQHNFKTGKVLFDERIYQASVADIIKVLGEINDAKTAMFIGHNPAITEVAELLSRKRIENIPTSGIIGLQFETNNWSEIEIAKSKLLCVEFVERD